MDLRLDRVGLLLDQFASSCELSKARLDGMTDDEYLWKPTPGSLSIRPAAEVGTSALGRGDWRLEWPRPEPEPAPMRTMAWLLGHLYDGFLGRYEWTFGARRADPRTLATFTPSAAEALARLWELLDRWKDAVAGLTDEQLDRPGFGQYPFGLDPQLPFIGIVWWTNRELIHHLAEVALLRDLYAARGAP
jgi:DinB superfamily